MSGGGKKIGQGTHGAIFTIDENTVEKKFQNRPAPNMCLCDKIRTDCGSVCDNVEYEFQIQKY